MHTDIHLLVDTMCSDPFLVSPVAENPIANGVPGELKLPTGRQVPLTTADPSSLSPKRREPCRPLTESMQQEKDVPMSEKPSIAPTPPLAVGPPPLLPSRPTIGGQEATLNNGFVGGQHGQGEWMDSSRQVGGGYVFHPPGQYLPYHGGEHGPMLPPQGPAIPVQGCHITRPKVFIVKTRIEAIPVVLMEVFTLVFYPLGHIKICREMSLTKITLTAPTSWVQPLMPVAVQHASLIRGILNIYHLHPSSPLHHARPPAVPIEHFTSFLACGLLFELYSCCCCIHATSCPCSSYKSFRHVRI